MSTQMIFLKIARSGNTGRVPDLTYCAVDLDFMECEKFERDSTGVWHFANHDTLSEHIALGDQPFTQSELRTGVHTFEALVVRSTVITEDEYLVAKRKYIGE